MSKQVIPSQEQFWQQTLQCWADPTLEQAALWLQDQHGLDPNLLLLLAWQQQLGRYLDVSQVTSLASAIAPWVRDVVHPYRQLRQRAKDQLAAADYQQMKQLELSLERQTQRQLLDALAQCRPTGATDRETNNLATCLRYLGLQPHRLPRAHYLALQRHFEC